LVCCVVIIKMVKLLVMGACCAGVLLDILNRVLFVLFLLLCKVYPQYSLYSYVRSIRIVLSRNPILVDFVWDSVFHGYCAVCFLSPHGDDSNTVAMVLS
jgi:hypothetical protein